MAVTLGVMLHVDRAPAVAVPPVQLNVIGTKPITQLSVGPVEASRQGQLGLYYSRGSQSAYPTYDIHGARRPGEEQNGSRLDLFA